MRFFLFATASRLLLGPTQPPKQWTLGTLIPGVKRPGRQADHSPSSSAEVKEWVELYLHSPNTFSLRRAQLKAQGQLYLYLLKLNVLNWMVARIPGIHSALNFFVNVILIYFFFHTFAICRIFKRFIVLMLWFFLYRHIFKIKVQILLMRSMFNILQQFLSHEPFFLIDDFTRYIAFSLLYVRC
jgi:hypothetical protein